MASKSKVMLDDDVPELTDADLAEFRPARDVMTPAAFEAVSSVRRGRPRGSTKEPVTLRVDSDLVAAFKATGKGWQTRMNEAMRDGASRMPSIGPIRPNPDPSAPFRKAGTTTAPAQAIKADAVKKRA